VRPDRLVNAAILILATLIGIVAFAYPFLVPEAATRPAAIAHAQDAPLVTLALTALVVVTVIANLTSHQMSARTIAVLGILTAVNAVLRAVPGPGGFSGIFFLLALCGYVYGSTFGFLVGPRAELLMLTAWTSVWGFAFGVVMNLWFWPYISAVQTPINQNWEAGLRLLEAVKRYGTFYAATSLWWDVWRAAGNAGLILFLGAPLLKVLRRFEHVLGFERLH